MTELVSGVPYFKVRQSGYSAMGKHLYAEYRESRCRSSLIVMSSTHDNSTETITAGVFHSPMQADVMTPKVTTKFFFRGLGFNIWLSDPLL